MTDCKLVAWEMNWKNRLPCIWQGTTCKATWGKRRHNWVCQRSGYTKGSAWNPTRNEVLPTKCPELVLHWLEFAPELLAFRTNKRAKRFIKSPGVDKTAETLSEQNSTYCWATAMHYTPGKALLDYLCFAIVCVWMCFLFCCVFFSLSLSLHLWHHDSADSLPHCCQTNNHRTIAYLRRMYNHVNTSHRGTLNTAWFRLKLPAPKIEHN